MPDFVSRRPDYNVTALNKSTSEKGTIGAAWVQEDGTIRIKINSFIILQGSSDLIITMFPIDSTSPSKEPYTKPGNKKPGRSIQTPSPDKPVDGGGKNPF